MTVWPFIHFFCVIFDLFIGAYILIKNPRDRLNQVFAMTVLCFAFWAASIVFLNNPYVSEDTMITCSKIFSPGWIFFPSFSLWFFLIFLGYKRILQSRLFYSIIFIIPSAIYFRRLEGGLLVGYTNTAYGWTNTWERSFWSYGYFLYIFVFIFTCLVLLIKQWIKTDDPLLKKQCMIMAVTGFTGLIIGSMLNIVLPLLSIVPPYNGSLTTLLWITGIAYAIARYKLMVISPSTAAENIISTMSDSLILVDRKGTIITANAALESLTGRGITDLVNRNADFIFDDNQKKISLPDEIIRHDPIKNREFYFNTVQNEKIPVLLSCSVLRDNLKNMSGIVCVARDNSERKLAEKKIKGLLSEKEHILKEVHHRIKNNMSIINSLLVLHSATLKDTSAVEALEDARNRILSMMLLYEKLYQSTNYNEISVEIYLPDLVDEIIGNFPNSGSVKVEKNIGEFAIDSKRISILGIILNELLTNVMKYAFTGRDDGIISVSASLNGGVISIIVQDNGIGIPVEVDIHNSTHFGLSLVEILTSQLNGTLKLERENGTKFILEFEK